MSKSKLTILLLAGMMITLSSCGIFHKGCGCPKFGKTLDNVQMREDVRMCECADVRMIC